MRQAQVGLSVENMRREIIKQFGKFGVKIDIEGQKVIRNRVIFLTKMKGNSRETHLRAHAPDVQLRLKLPQFYVEKYGFDLVIVASRAEIEYPHLPLLLKDPNIQAELRSTALPYIVGYDALGEVVVEDLSEFPHLLLGGSTKSGKSVGLKSLVTSIAYIRAPSNVNFVLIDVGATDLLAFNGIPHLSYPVVQDRTTAMRVLKALVIEMEQRAKLENATSFRYAMMPHLVIVIDEFPALFTGIDKAAIKELTADISALLQRGRHAKIHLVLTAQNPSFQNMKVDIGNITVRIAFKCAKKNFSEVILGECGAEKLLGNGELLLKSPQNSDVQRLQGSYITSEEIKKIVSKIIEMYKDSPRGLSFSISDDMIREAPSLIDCPSHSVVKNRPSEDNQLFAQVILCTLGENSISTNSIKRNFHLGWDRAANLIRLMEELGIVEMCKGKQARYVRPKCMEDLCDELLEFLESCNISRVSVALAFQKRAASNRRHIQQESSGGVQNG